MTNPFQAFNISDDEETFQPATEQKVKRTHQEKKLYKQQQAQVAAKTVTTNTAPVVTEQPPEKQKENAKLKRHNNATPSYVAKKLGDGHYHDRQSGTGRPDRPRKEGGGWGNVGNLKDEFKKDKYVKESPEKARPEGEAPVAEGEAPAAEPVVEPKPQEPEAPTLEEYYKSKGVEITNTFEKKAPVKKTDVNAEWIKKEKLTVLESKEDKKISERNGQNVVKFSSARVGLDENLEGLGFFSQKTEKKHEERRDNKHHENRGGKGKKIVVHEEDFPSL